jgi:hypothetical protein
MKGINSLLDLTVGEIQDNVVYKHFGESYLFNTASREKIDPIIRISNSNNRETSLPLLTDPVIEFIENVRLRRETDQKDNKKAETSQTRYVCLDTSSKK